MMTPTPEPVGPENQRAWDLVMAIHVLGLVEWDLFLELCRAADYGSSVPMGFFEETWEGRHLAGDQKAGALLRGGKAEGVELSKYGHEWIPGELRKHSLPARLRWSKNLPTLLKTAQHWQDERERATRAD